MVLSPQQSSAPVVVRAQECFPPSASDVACVPAGRRARVGAGRRTVVPSPTPPASFEPQQETFPVVRTTQVWYRPAAIVWAPNPTETGVAEPVLLIPVPSWPLELS